ncbi:polyketide cyclase [Paenibacillaceae bacterium]|nr:polyketide cyclase [Paenibacillaceae bacterium]
MDLKYVFFIAAAPEKVWNILVSPEGTSRTLFGSVIRSSFKPGEDLAYVGPGNEGDETVHVYGKLLEFIPLERFSYTEHPGPSYSPNHEALESRITFTLESVGECTKLTLVNDKWSSNHPSHSKTQEVWPVVMSNIKTLAETGQTLDLGW